MGPVECNRSGLSRPGYAWTSERLSRRLLISHILCLLFSIPALSLYAVDLHAYVAQVHPTPYSISHGTRDSKSNQITDLDGIALVCLSLSILYGTSVLAVIQYTRRRFDPSIFYRYIILITFTDYVLGVTVFTVSIMSIAQRAYTSNCQDSLSFDEGACDAYRRSIVKAAGSMGILSGVATQLRLGMDHSVFRDRRHHWGAWIGNTDGRA